MVTGSSKWGTPYIFGDDDQPHCHRPNRVSADSMWRLSVARVWNSVGLCPLFNTLFTVLEQSILSVRTLKHNIPCYVHTNPNKC